MTDSCHCGSAGLFGYRQSEEFVWCCEQHRLAHWWVDARRDGSTRHLILDAGGMVPANQGHQEAKEDPAMDMRKYSSGFIKPDDVRESPRQERIIHIFESEKYGCPVLEFESGDQFSLNASNNKILCKAYGWESDHWLNHVIELSLGHYKDWRTDPPEEKETVVIRAISARQPSPENGGTKAAQATPRPPARGDMDDEIPF
jgi:hypothetical protein